MKEEEKQEEEAAASARHRRSLQAASSSSFRLPSTASNFFFFLLGPQLPPLCRSSQQASSSSSSSCSAPICNGPCTGLYLNRYKWVVSPNRDRFFKYWLILEHIGTDRTDVWYTIISFISDHYILQGNMNQLLKSYLILRFKIWIHSQAICTG